MPRTLTATIRIQLGILFDETQVIILTWTKDCEYAGQINSICGAVINLCFMCDQANYGGCGFFTFWTSCGGNVCCQMPGAGNGQDNTPPCTCAPFFWHTHFTPVLNGCVDNCKNANWTVTITN